MIKYNNNTINDWDFGTSNIKKVYRNNSVCYYKISGTPPRLPSGYTEVEYIENVSPNMAYIDTNFQPNQDTRILTDIQIVTSTDYGKLFSSGQWDGLNAIQLQYEVGVAGTLLIDWGTATGHYNTNINGDYNRHTYDWDKNNFYLDGTLIASTTYGNFQCTCNLLIFRASSTSCAPTMHSEEVEFAKLFSFKIYDDGTLVRDLVPCKRDNDSMVGMYDLVNDVFYYPPNYQSYQMVAGPKV